MKLHIEKIRLSELESFVNSRRFSEMETVPISRNRAESYLQNPHGQPNDVVLYLGFIGEKPVAFRSLFADVIHSGNSSIRFAWCSGNWVHPGYRRNGFSEQLLQEAYTDWNQKLMFTNYAPASEQLYLKTGWFRPIHQFEGVRAYLFPKTRKLVAAGNKTVFSRSLFSIVDAGIYLLSSIRLLFYKPQPNGNFRFETIGLPDEACYAFLTNNRPEHAFQRYQKELTWIFAFPWLSNTNATSNYPFSQYSGKFNYRTLKIYDNEQLAGFCIISNREGHLKTLYFAVPQAAMQPLANYLKQMAKNEKTELLTVYKKELATLLLKRKFPFLRVKIYGQKIYSTFDLPGTGNLQFQDGDGDVIFT